MPARWTLSRSTFLVLILAAVCQVATAQQWNQWRGPHRDGLAAGSPRLLDALPREGLSPVWISESDVPTGGGGGWSSPLVAGDRVYVFAHLKSRREGVELPAEEFPKLDSADREKLSRDEQDEYERSRRAEQLRRRERQYRWDEVLVCLDAASGKPLWTNRRESRLTRFPQSASPAVVDGVVFVHGARGAVRAIDAGSGKDLWKLQLPGEFDDGPHPASPAVADGVVIVVAGRLFGIDARSGKLRWRGEEEIEADDASPALWRRAGREFVIARDGEDTICVDAKTGRTQWRVESLAGRSSPVVAGDRLITYGNSRKGGLRCFAMSPDKAELLWTNNSVADEGASPVVVDGNVFVHGDRRLACIDLATGKLEWRRELEIQRPRYTSLIAGDGKVILAAGGLLCFAADAAECRLLADGRFDREGRLASAAYFRRILNIDELESTAEGQRQAESLWRKQIEGGGPAQCVSPALADGRLYLRLKDNRVACYDLRRR